MKNRTDSRPLLDWLLSRGALTLSIKLRREGNRYQVSIDRGGADEHLHVTRVGAGRKAFQLHAEWVAAFRDAGWTSVAYR